MGDDGTRVVVLGVGLHPFGRFPEKRVAELGRTAALEAMKDAGVGYKDIQAGYCGRVVANAGVGLAIFEELGSTGIPVTNVELACASSSRAAELAANGIKAGAHDMCLVVGVEKMSAACSPWARCPAVGWASPALWAWLCCPESTLCRPSAIWRSTIASRSISPRSP